MRPIPHIPERRSPLADIGAAVILLFGLLLVPGCAATGKSHPLGGPGPTRPVWVVAPGWHSGLVVRRADLPDDLFPESADFPKATYLEVGWGDREYYRARDPGLWLALRAALVPGPSVLHVAGFRESPAAYFAPGEVRRIDLPEPAFRDLAAYLHRSIHRSGKARASPLGPGLYGDSRFYEAEGRFHLFNNCNAWTARGLRAAGLPAVPALAVTAGTLRGQARQWGRVEPASAR